MSSPSDPLAQRDAHLRVVDDDRRARIERYRARFDEIEARTSAMGEERGRLIAELYAGAPKAERDALDDTHQEWLDGFHDRATASLAQTCHANGLGLTAACHPDELDRIADAWPDQDSWTVRNLRTQARSRRDNTHPRRLAQTPLLPRRPHVGTARGAGRRRARRTASSRAGPSDDSGEPAGDGDASSPALLRLGLSLSAVRRCGSCGVFAFAVDRYQRAQLDALGFRDGLCPDCAREVER